MLKLYALFHCNLAFSMVPSAHFSKIIEKCYRPLLTLASNGLPIAIEMSACTLKIVNRLDPSFVTELKELWLNDKCEFVGSGFTQAIFPLIPAAVNRWNLEAGNRVYKELLGQIPETALVNEQTYSKGLVDLYTEAGYRRLIMDWNNCFQHNKYPEADKFYPQKAVGFKTGIDVIWSNSIAFQKFQRTVHGEVETDDYIEYLFGHNQDKSENRDTVFVIYCNDAEVFDYRPGKEVEIDGEYDRIGALLTRIVNDKRAELLTPKSIVAGFEGCTNAHKPLSLESVEMPVVTKKQGKYNPVRWAAAGRDSVHINTECYKVFNSVFALIESGLLSVKETEPLKESVAEIWGSDFRTNTIDEKFLYFHKLLGGLKVKTESLAKQYKVELPLSGHGATEVQSTGNANDTGVQVTKTASTLTVVTETVETQFLINKGLAIKGLIFPGISPEPLIGTIEHGYFNDISLGADFFSGHLIHLTKEAAKCTDLQGTEPVIVHDAIAVNVSVKMALDIGTLWKTYRVFKEEQKLEVTYRIQVNGLSASSLRLGIFTLLPNAFKTDSLWIESINGADLPERFALKGHTVAHDAPACPGVSASGCLGATDGVVTVGDSDKSVSISTDKSALYSVPMVNYRDVDGSFFLRIYHSIGEVDDTAWWVWRGYNEISFTVTAKKAGVQGI